MVRKTRVSVIYCGLGQYAGNLSYVDEIPDFSPPGHRFSVVEDVTNDNITHIVETARKEARGRGIPYVVNLDD